MSDADLTAGAYTLAFFLAAVLVATAIGWVGSLERINHLADENRRLTVENDRLTAHECNAPDEVTALRARLETYRHNAGRHIEGTFTDTTNQEK